MKVSYYPGCSLHATGKEYDQSMKAVSRALNIELKEGKSVQQSCMDAVNKRMRPIMLSTNTTIIGLAPLVYSGSALFTPMAIALMSGLLVSMVLTLVVIPIIYSIVMERFHQSQPSDK